MSHSDLPLFAWTPPRKLIVFPMVNRIGKIRDVALKLAEKATDRHAEYYQQQVTQALIAQFEKIGLSEIEQDEQLGAFWSKVRDEMVRQSYGGGRGSNNPKGAV